ncbi:hypothetical protein J6590_098224, partial [Homalodisca vitripennis]
RKYSSSHDESNPLPSLHQTYLQSTDLCVRCSLMNTLRYRQPLLSRYAIRLRRSLALRSTRPYHLRVRKDGTLCIATISSGRRVNPIVLLTFPINYAANIFLSGYGDSSYFNFISYCSILLT